jgi:3-dehydroquinate synthase
MNTLTVELGDRSYPIYIGAGLLDRGDLLTAALAGRQVMVVTNEVIAPLYLERVVRSLAGYQVAHVVLPDGEQHKNLEALNEIVGQLLRHRFSRNCTLIALGGGVIGDIAGFAAACYQRGVAYVQIPTTLLAQVDSAVGGKTAVNHPLGKNMIGAFHQPRAVIADTDTLRTLPDRELAAGMAEIIKYGLIRDAEFFAWLERNIVRLLEREPETLACAIERSCRNKAEVVAADERESGMRALLNLGHTFGHAIETALDYRDWLHGEAVAAGMIMAADLSRRIGWLKATDERRIRALVAAATLPLKPPAGLNAGRLRELMNVDKKARDGVLHLVLLKDIGAAVVTNQYPPAELAATLAHFCSTPETA